MKKFPKRKDLQEPKKSPHALLLLLFDGAMRYARRSIRCIEAEDDAGRDLYTKKAQAIVQELRDGWDHRPSPELTHAMQALCEYILGRLARGAAEDDTAAIEEAVELLATLRTGFADSNQ
ncbi:flagellar export chaperone FliS [Candidatus Pacearchaeota archaeon]|nr:flagellar export chaperone FliS [Candidatus Pacearchaeota archaeon]|tara:strand:- start:1181 stop:1540 length:360 start_codon:yes stop_codon:yes gene_type:complete